MKKQKTKQASGAGQKREAEEALSVPTLGQVAEEEDFAPLRGLIQPVARRPVNELGEALRGWLEAEATKAGQLPVALALIDACAARAREIERKRARVGSGEESPGKQRRERLVFFPVCSGSLCLILLRKGARRLLRPRRCPGCSSRSRQSTSRVSTC
jgi:hypothetical protein